MNTYYEEIFKEKTIDTLKIYLEAISICTLESFSKKFSEIPENAAEEYIDYYQKIFANYYLYLRTIEYFNNKASKTPTISFRNFSEACKSLRKHLLFLVNTNFAFSDNTERLVKFITETKEIDPATGNSQMFNYKQRFWKHFVEKRPIDPPSSVQTLFSDINNSTTRKSSVDTNLENKPTGQKTNPLLYQEELPFYCILFYIYYWGKIYKVDFDDCNFSIPNKPIKDLLKNKPNTKIIEWCIGCYHEWLEEFGPNYQKTDDNLLLSEYIYGIPLIFQRFQYHKSKGKQLLFNRLKFLLELYNESELLLSVPGIEESIKNEIIHLKSTFIPNATIYQNKRKDENQIKVVNDTRYIHTSIRNYFNLSEIPFCNLLGDTEQERRYMTDQELFSKNSCKLIASLFMAYAESYNTNDPLPYITINYIVSYHCWLLGSWSETHIESPEDFRSADNIELVLSTLHDGLHGMIKDLKKLGLEGIYSKLLLPYYKDAVKELKIPESKWRDFLYDEFLNNLTKKDIIVFSTLT